MRHEFTDNLQNISQYVYILIKERCQIDSLFDFFIFQSKKLIFAISMNLLKTHQIFLNSQNFYVNIKFKNGTKFTGRRIWYRYLKIYFLVIVLRTKYSKKTLEKLFRSKNKEFGREG